MNLNPPWETHSEAGLLELLCGNADAARFVVDIAQCSHAYDDLIDRDKPIPDSTVHGLMWKLLVSVPTNPFFRQHQDTIRPALITGILNWHAATEMENTGEREELHIAHALRYALGDVVLLCMAIVGGHQHAMTNARRARLMVQADTWANYASEHAQPAAVNYDDETADFVAHGIGVYDSSLLDETEAGHCRKLFEFAGLEGWLEQKTVVDVGCGAGGVLEHMRGAYPNNCFAGATNSRVQLQIIKDKGLAPVYADMDCLDLPYADLFVFTQSIGHAKSMPDVMAECARKLKPGGRLLIKDVDASAQCLAGTWNYRIEPFEHFTLAAKRAGLKVLKVEFPEADHTRYLRYWQASHYMQSTHGRPYSMPARTALFLFEKPATQENPDVQPQED